MIPAREAQKRTVAPKCRALCTLPWPGWKVATRASLEPCVLAYIGNAPAESCMVWKGVQRAHAGTFMWQVLSLVMPCPVVAPEGSHAPSAQCTARTEAPRLATERCGGLTMVWLSFGFGLCGVSRFWPWPHARDMVCQQKGFNAVFWGFHEPDLGLKARWRECI